MRPGRGLARATTKIVNPHSAIDAAASICRGPRIAIGFAVPLTNNKVDPMRTNGFLNGRWVVIGMLTASALVTSGCGTASLIMSAAGAATDTSVTWDIVKHLHAKITEGDDLSCRQLDTVQRALNVRCGAFVPGSLLAADIRRSPLQGCALAVAAGDARFWPALPELIEKGAQPEACPRSPLVELAQSQTCPDFSNASPAVLQSMRWLADADSRAIHHDVVRMLSCPNAVRAGLDQPLANWLAQGDLDPGKVSFGPLGALHPSYLGTPLASALEQKGHTARSGLGGYEGLQPRGFEMALRQSDWPALDWWLTRVPELANRVPPTQGNQLPWVPLARALTPGFLANAANQASTIEFLMARGANPWQKLPFDANSSVVQYARSLKSPLISLLDPPLATPVPTTVIATGEAVPAR
jgi:hypothetical protein